MSLPTVAIVGRPNVGKSSLFNRILKRRQAVVDSESGVTRDRHYARGDWNGIEFRLVDTGGMVPGSRDEMEQAIFEQSDIAVGEADLILLVVDVKTVPDALDDRLAALLMRSEKTSLLVVNKVDNEDLRSDAYEFLKLGLGEPFMVSATQGYGVAELLDEIVKQLPDMEPESSVPETIRVALVGRPNVGKSSFINKLLGEERLIVSEKAGTTRDAVDTPYELDGQRYLLIDTAGLRRKFKVRENLEFYTNLRSNKAIDDCDVGVVLIDGSEGMTAQDQRVLASVIECRRPAVLAVNKWDLVDKDSLTADRFAAEIKRDLARLSFIPIVFCSALTGQRVTRIMSKVNDVHKQNRRRIPTSELNDFLKKVYARKKPPARNRKYIRFKYVTQSEISPPTFVFFANHPKLIDRSYVSYLTNQLRADFGFEGVPIRLKFRRS